MDWKIPDWASVIGLLWAVGVTVFAVVQSHKQRQSDKLTHRFLVGLKAAVPPNVQRQIDDELERVKPAKRLGQ